jgi:hypothetical protein
LLQALINLDISSEGRGRCLRRNELTSPTGPPPEFKREVKPLKTIKDHDRPDSPIKSVHKHADFYKTIRRLEAFN